MDDWGAEGVAYIFHVDIELQFLFIIVSCPLLSYCKEHQVQQRAVSRSKSEYK